MANTRRLIELGMAPTLAKELETQIETGGAMPTWDSITGKPATFAPTIGATADTAKAGNYVPAYADVTGKPATFPPTIGATATTAMAGNTAIPVASAVAGAALAAAGAVGVATAFARADHVHPIPGASVGAVRGTVLIQAAIPNAAAAPTQAEFNAVLTALRSAGVIAP